MTTPVTETYRADWEAWRAGWEQWLAQPHNWLSAVAVNWLDDTPHWFDGTPGRFEPFDTERSLALGTVGWREHGYLSPTVDRPRVVVASGWSAGTTAEDRAVQQDGQLYCRNTTAVSPRTSPQCRHAMSDPTSTRLSSIRFIDARSALPRVSPVTRERSRRASRSRDRSVSPRNRRPRLLPHPSSQLARTRVGVNVTMQRSSAA